MSLLSTIEAFDGLRRHSGIPTLLLATQARFGNNRENALTITTDRTGPLSVRPGTEDVSVVAELIRDDLYTIPDWYFDMARAQDKRSIRVLDLGANIGSTAAYFCKQIQLQLFTPHIVSLEPEPGNYRQLELNARMKCRNGFITPVHAAIGSVPGSCAINTIRSPRRTSTFTVDHTSNTDGIPVMTIQQLIESPEYFNGFNPDIIKCDIEGAERELFSGDTTWFSPTLFFVERHDRISSRQYDFSTVERVLRESGFNRYPLYGNADDELYISKFAWHDAW